MCDRPILRFAPAELFAPLFVDATLLASGPGACVVRARRATAVDDGGGGGATAAAADSASPSSSQSSLSSLLRPRATLGAWREDGILTLDGALLRREREREALAGRRAALGDDGCDDGEDDGFDADGFERTAAASSSAVAPSSASSSSSSSSFQTLSSSTATVPQASSSRCSRSTSLSSQRTAAAVMAETTTPTTETAARHLPWRVCPGLFAAGAFDRYSSLLSGDRRTTR